MGRASAGPGRVATGEREYGQEQHIQAHIRAWAERGVISKWAVPEIRFVDVLEKTSVGKLDKNVLRQKYG